MPFRSDLALEQKESLSSLPKGATCETEQFADGTVTRLCITGKTAEKKLLRPQGRYITVEVPHFSDYANAESRCAPMIAEELRKLLPEEGLVLVAGLGNSEITPDAIGPRTIRKILATRHLAGTIAESFGIAALRPVATVAPNVLGKTGIDAAEIIHALVSELKPVSVIVIDALMARALERLGNTVQISDTGIAPGSGVGNPRPHISEKQLGVPVIAVGVPTVVDGLTLIRDLTGKPYAPGYARNREMTVTPKEIDLLVERAAETVALGVNFALQPDLTAEEIRLLLS